MRNLGVIFFTAAVAMSALTANAGPKLADLPPPPETPAQPKIKLKFSKPSYSYYPQRAVDGGVEGWAQIECLVMEQGKLKCELLSEAPEKYGFGAATLKLFKTVTVDLSQSEIKVGDRFVHLYRWTVS